VGRGEPTLNGNTPSDVTAPLRVTADDPTYRERAQAEAKFWQEVHPCGLEASNPAYADGPVDLYFNERFTGSRDLSWAGSIPRYGRFQRGLMLGTVSEPLESYILETNPSLHLTFMDISPGPLERRQAQLGKRYPGRVATLVADLNFAEMEPDSYDLVVSSGTVHHVTNLEYLAFQINRGLRAGGYFFLQDYVGEPRFGFTDEKKHVYEVIYNRDLLRQGSRRPGLVWMDESDLSPFCGVRSDAILATLSEQLEVVEERTAAALVVPLMRSRPLDDRTPQGTWDADAWKPYAPRWRWFLEKTRERFPSIRGKKKSPQCLLGQEFLNELFLVGDALVDAGILLPCLAFAVYRKRPMS
jgi:SAM-dependent methyltransferase